MADSNDWRACASCMSSFCVWRLSCSSSTMRSVAREMMSFSLFFVAMEMEEVPRSISFFCGFSDKSATSIGYGTFPRK